MSIRWLLPHGYLLEWDEYRDSFTLTTPSNGFCYKVEHPHSTPGLDIWISRVERYANVRPGTFTKELGDFYGEYRKAKSKIYCNTYQSAYQSAGGALGNYANQSSVAQAQLAYYAAAPSYAGLGTLAGALGHPATLPMSALGSGPSTISPPWAPTDLKSEGIRAGEIIAWRAWLVIGDYLHSVVAAKPWTPGEPMSGDPATGYGIHAYKGPHGPMLDGYAQKGNGPWVIGEVALWGEIIEHEEGYRAEFARVHSLVTWSESVAPHFRQVITEKYITSQPIYKIEDAA